jgi:hypothetical protein
VTADRIRELNDTFRRTFSGGRVVMTAGIQALPERAQAAVLERVRSFDDFTLDNDPHGEHDFGSFEFSGVEVFWKIDYCDVTIEAGSEEPADPSTTTRVLTIMLASEY